MWMPITYLTAGSLLYAECCWITALGQKHCCNSFKKKIGCKVRILPLEQIHALMKALTDSYLFLTRVTAL